MLDWDDLRFFLAVARGGNLSSAARTLGVAQPTVGRRVSALQIRLGTRLFERTPEGHALTPSGRAVLRLVENVETQALAVERFATGRDVGLSGVVRLTATEWFSRQVVAPLLGRFAEKNPDILVEVLADVRLYSLARREADIALRLGAFPERDVLRRKLARVAFGVYASPAYLSRRGSWPADGAHERHRVIEMVDARGAPFPDSAWLTALAPGARVAARTTSRDGQAALASAGLGLTTLPRHLGDHVPTLRRLSTPTTPPPRDLWLGVHRQARSTPRVRALVDFLAAELPRQRKALDP
ncbi:MAG TPA: LysR family transcriptional regulator [Polyangia bacterium]